MPAAAPIIVPTLTMAQLRLRPFRPDDAAWVYYVSLDPELRRQLSLPEPYHRSHARYFVDQIAIATAQAGQGADFVIEDSDTEIALGWVGLHRQRGDALGCGYWLAADARGRGLMTRALRAACEWALTPPPAGLGARAIHWQAHVGNYASRAVAERVGFCIQPETVPGRTTEKWVGVLETESLRPDR
ncbi:MAG: GNAT family N-acetyltransferase [Mycobacterium sp.]|nr:GNAT family N-acetyltransferase [Mycobacterium sp.]